jgi:hypothetical protein
MNPTDEEFVVRLRDGDDLALNELINRWQQPVTRNIYRFLAIRQMLLIWRSRFSFEYSSKNLDLGRSESSPPGRRSVQNTVTIRKDRRCSISIWNDGGADPGVLYEYQNGFPG